MAQVQLNQKTDKPAKLPKPPKDSEGQGLKMMVKLLDRHQRVVKQIAGLQERVQAAAKRETDSKWAPVVVAWSDAVASSREAIDAGLKVANELAKRGYAIRNGGPTTLGVGQNVWIRKGVRAEYAVVSDEELDGLVVESVSDRTVRCKTDGGLVLIVKRGHLATKPQAYSEAA